MEKAADIAPFLSDKVEGKEDLIAMKKRWDTIRPMLDDISDEQLDYLVQAGPKFDHHHDTLTAEFQETSRLWQELRSAEQKSAEKIQVSV